MTIEHHTGAISTEGVWKVRNNVQTLLPLARCIDSSVLELAVQVMDLQVEVNELLRQAGDAQSELGLSEWLGLEELLAVMGAIWRRADKCEIHDAAPWWLRQHGLHGLGID